MTKFGLNLVPITFPKKKKKKKNKTWLQLMARTLTIKINYYNFENLILKLHVLFLTCISNFMLIIHYLIFDP